jgi:hypothetical protein
MFAYVETSPSGGRVCFSRLVQSANEYIEAESVAPSGTSCSTIVCAGLRYLRPYHNAISPKSSSVLSHPAVVVASMSERLGAFKAQVLNVVVRDTLLEPVRLDLLLRWLARIRPHLAALEYAKRLSSIVGWVLRLARWWVLRLIRDDHIPSRLAF